MQFEFNIYSTPLLFGFVQGWLYAVFFWVRGWRQGRRSDWFFGALLAALTFEIWEYMLGFAGIEILWKELDFFPRNFGLLIPPLAYFYLKSQFNAAYRPVWRDFGHVVPFLVYLAYHLLVFAAGSDFVQFWKEKVHFPFGMHLESVAIFGSQVAYFYWSIQLFRAYRQWAPTQFSDTDRVSFDWFRQFLIAFLAANIIGWGMTLADLFFNLDFWHDWWDELFMVAMIYYLAVAGYAQPQPHKLDFSPAAPDFGETQVTSKAEKVAEPDLLRLKTSLEKMMVEEKPYLEPELTLSNLAARLGTNISVLSAVINTAFGKNFNDFVNEYRVEAVKKLLKDPSGSHLSLLGIGLECGFNSKSTFNRAFKKLTGAAPGDFK